jgi:4-amino-4-deoxy-L-arabinose transferase-like glycosyltransferase
LILWKYFFNENNEIHILKETKLPFFYHSFEFKLAMLALGMRIFGMVVIMAVLFETFDSPFAMGTWGDDKTYHNVAMRISRGWIEGSWKTKLPFAAEYSGYPILLSWIYYLFVPSHFVGILANIFFGVLTCIITYRFGRITFGEEIAKNAAVLLAIFPLHIYYCSFTLKDSFLLLLISVTALACQRALYENKPIVWLILFFTCIKLLSYFRVQVGILFLLIFSIGLFINYRHTWRILPALILSLWTVYLLYQDHIAIDKIRDLSYYWSQHVVDYQRQEVLKMRSLTAGTQSRIGVILVVFGYILPFPTLAKLELGKSATWQIASSIFAWNLIAGLSLVGMYLVIKKDFRLKWIVWSTPIVIFIGQATVYTSTILDIRRKLMLAPFACILAAYAFKEWESPHRRPLIVLYFIGVMVGTAVYTFLRLQARGIW